MPTRQDLLTSLDLIMVKHGAIEAMPYEIRHAASIISEFIDIMLPADDSSALAPEWVTVGEMTPAFECYLPGERWNGWDCPWFGERSLRQLAHYIAHDDEWNATLTEFPDNPPETRWQYTDHNATPYNGTHYLPANPGHVHPVSGEAEPLWDFSNGMCWLTVNR